MTLKVLALHGSQQNGEVMRTRLGRIVPKIKKIASFSYFDAPHSLPIKEGNEVSYRTWYIRENGVVNLISLSESLSALKIFWAKEGPFDGIFGFSQGGAIGALLATKPNLFPGLKFVILSSAPDIHELENLSGTSTFAVSSAIKSLHFAGLADIVVPLNVSRELASRFESSQFFEHEQGHCIPTKPGMIALMANFLESQLLSKTVASQSKLSSSGVVPDGHKLFGDTQLKSTVVSVRAAATPEVEVLMNCSSDANVAEQQDEMEAISAIYSEQEIHIVRPAPMSTSYPSACFTIVLTSASADLQGIPPCWEGQISLTLDFPPDYPNGDNPLQPTVELGALSMMDFPIAYKKSLQAAISAAAQRTIGSPGAFACIQGAHDWLASEGWKTSQDVVSPLARSVEAAIGKEPLRISALTLVEEINASGWSGKNVDEDEAERKEWECVRAATDEAWSRAANVMQRRNRRTKKVTDDGNSTTSASHPLDVSPKITTPTRSSVHSDDNSLGKSSSNGYSSEDDFYSEEKCLSEAALSGKGVWAYTVGLVGKPSAGKSTFFNAATCAALRSGDGRKMADVAPHPFTTIEPNIGPGWFSGPSHPHDGPTSENSSAYGRDSRGCRLLPVMIKDVAGLVPGAYKGRGKGNRFLADLCDADVLVHVVDATGRSDRDGNALGGGEIGSSPSEDAQWIREELHRWIHGNIRAKWPSVCRRGIDSAQRVVELFTGYKGPRYCVETAGIRARLSVVTAKGWTPLDLHRFVAHYLTIRFPICLALNKIDAFPVSVKGVKTGGIDHASSSCDDGKGIIALCQQQAVQRGELAVPVSAFAETWQILKQVAQLQEQEQQQPSVPKQTRDPPLDRDPIVEESHLSLKHHTHSRGDVDDCVGEEEGREVKAVCPKRGSAVWLKNEAILDRVKRTWLSTGVLEAVSAAVSLKPPVYCYPVGDLTLESPVGWVHNGGVSDNPTLSEKGGIHDCRPIGSSSGAGVPRLRDCILLQPGSTVGDLYDALKRGALPHVVVHGDFVRSEGKGLHSAMHAASLLEDPLSSQVGVGNAAPKKRQLGRDIIIDDSCCVIRIQTNRKALWQQHTIAAAAQTASSIL